MAAFKFRLEQVIGLRTRQRDAAAADYRTAIEKARQLEAMIAELEEEIASQKKIQSTTVGQTIDPQRHINSQRYELSILRQITEIRSNLNLVEQECEKRRKVMVCKEQDLKSIENLRDKQRSQWIDEQNRVEQLALDEWAATKHWKSSRQK